MGEYSVLGLVGIPEITRRPMVSADSFYLILAGSLYSLFYAWRLVSGIDNHIS